MKKKKFNVVEYEDNINSYDQYSLEVDPSNLYNFSELEKNFIELYVEYKNLAVVAKLLNLDEHTTLSTFNKYAVKEEIRRLNRAHYQKIFSQKMLKIDEIGAWLTSIINEDWVDKNVAIKDKLKASELLINICKFKEESIIDPSSLMKTDIDILEKEIKSLSVKDLKKLIEKTDDNESKKELINKIPSSSLLTEEDKKILMSLSIDELKKMIE